MSVAVQSGLSAKMDHEETIERKKLRYFQLINSDVAPEDEDGLKAKEQAVLSLGALLAETKSAQQLADLIQQTRPFLQQVSKAKAGKLVRTLVDLLLDLEAGTGREVDLCRECIDWANNEKRTFLRQALEAKLMGIYYECQHYEEALLLGTNLLRELKKLDDKALLVEVQLLESKVYYRLSNLQRSRAALTSARTTANGIYCPPKLQASLDLMSGILHAADERDFKTAFSYFYEAFEGYDSVNCSKAVAALKYMLMAKIMLNCADEIPGIVSGKLALRYAGPDVEAMKEIGTAAKKRSLRDFLDIKERYRDQLLDDPVISKHLTTLYDTLLGQNLSRLIEPYSRVQISHIAKLINLPQEAVEKKLSQMILDKNLNGILDQGSGVLVLYEDKSEDKDYKTALDIVHCLSRVVDQLYHKAKKLT